MNPSTIDLDRMRQYVANKFVSEKTWMSHGGRVLCLFNYTPKCVSEREWNDLTLMARGIVTDQEGNIVVRPFDKFFNLEEWKSVMPFGHVEVYEKVDGSLINIAWTHKDGLIVTSRGSFNSDQAQHARQLIVDRYGQDWIVPNQTYICEVVYPENRIVVNYGTTDELVLLGIRYPNGGELSYSSMLDEAVPFRTAERVATYPSFDDLMKADLRSTIQPNSEGYVFRFADGFRLKLKGEEYLRLHRIVTNTNNKTIWEMCANDMSFENIILNVPDEFMHWVKKIRQDFVREFLEIDQRHAEVYDILSHLPRPKFAAGVNDYVRSGYKGHEVNSGILFRMKDGKPHKDLIWKMLKPTTLLVPPVGEIEGGIYVSSAQ